MYSGLTPIYDVNNEIVNSIKNEIDLYHFCLTNKNNFNLCRNTSHIKKVMTVASRITDKLNYLFDSFIFIIGVGRTEPIDDIEVDDTIFFDIRLNDINQYIYIGHYDNDIFINTISLNYDYLYHMWIATLSCYEPDLDVILVVVDIKLNKKDMYYFLYYLFRKYHYNLM